MRCIIHTHTRAKVCWLSCGRRRQRVADLATYIVRLAVFLKEAQGLSLDLAGTLHTTGAGRHQTNWR